MSELTHGVFDTRPEPQLTPHALTRKQVETTISRFVSWHECDEACDHNLQQVLATDAAQRLMIVRQAQEIERLKAGWTDSVRYADQQEKDLAAMTAERDAFKAVLTGAEYEHVEAIGALSVEQATHLGNVAASCAKEILVERNALNTAIEAGIWHRQEQIEQIESLVVQLAATRKQLADSEKAAYDVHGVIAQLKFDMERLNETVGQLTRELVQVRAEKDEQWVALSAARHKVDQLRDALGQLYDVQNGCPLPKYEQAWNTAMQAAQQCLGLVQPST